MQTYKRRNYFIDKGAQSRFIIGFVLSSMLGGIIGVACFVYFARQKIDATLYSMRLPEVAVGELLIREMFVTLGVTSLIVLVLFFLTARKVFKRIDGPLKKMAGVIRRLGQGDLQDEVKLRENDEFQNLAQELDGMVKNMQSSFSSITNHAGLIKELSIRHDGPTDKNEQFRRHVTALKNEVALFKV